MFNALTPIVVIISGDSLFQATIDLAFWKKYRHNVKLRRTLVTATVIPTFSTVC